MNNLLHPEQLEEIKKTLIDEMAKRGVHAPLVEFDEVEKNGRYFISFQTEEFNTTPTMFKSICVDNFGGNVERATKKRIVENSDGEDSIDEADIIQIWMPVHFSYNHFSGGSNGCEFFTLHIDAWTSTSDYGSTNYIRLTGIS